MAGNFYTPASPVTADSLCITGRSRRRSFTNPRTITKGAIKDILKRVYYDELHVDPTHHPILFVDSPVSSEDFRKNILQILFQDFNVPACYLCSQPILSLHAQGKNTGVVVDSGHGSTYVAPVHEGKVLQSAVTQIPVAGRELDNFLALLCRKRGYAFHSSQEQHALRDIKEKQCYVSRDPNHELETSENRFFVERRVELPEGEIISLQTERLVPISSFHDIKKNHLPQVSLSGSSFQTFRFR